jgi:hypothetical protein
MRQRAAVTVLSCVLLLWSSRPAHAFDAWWHAEATRKAMVANGFSGDARLVAQFANYLVDFHSATGHYLDGFEGLYRRLPGGRPKNAPTTLRLDTADMKRLHFDSLFSTFEITRQWVVLESNTKAALRKYAADPSVKPGFRLIVLLSIVGASLHVVEDFYAHSNWVEGKKPVKTIFHRDPARDRILAVKAATLVLGGYWSNMVLVDNPYRLPTPYWAGFLVYHIERDLARGLTYDGRVR